ncbi:NUDIX hydrolase [Pelagibius marinus]|uniref:NUDIX hydrolase n=1 Tax=Pelagibius marinus TaxID=2762760 RepID=UPI0034603033
MCDNDSCWASQLKECDHTSVGILVWRNDKLLLIERKRPPYGMAPPAGHVDGHGSYMDAAIAELREEVGLSLRRLSLIVEGRKDNPCRRVSGNWHYWKVYRGEAIGRVSPSSIETKSYRWVSVPQLRELAHRTQQYLSGQVSETSWRQNPGLEPVWLDWLTEIEVLKS